VNMFIRKQVFETTHLPQLQTRLRSASVTFIPGAGIIEEYDLFEYTLMRNVVGCWYVIPAGELCGTTPFAESDTELCSKLNIELVPFTFVTECHMWGSTLRSHTVYFGTGVNGEDNAVVAEELVYKSEEDSFIRCRRNTCDMWTVSVEICAWVPDALEKVIFSMGETVNPSIGFIRAFARTDENGKYVWKKEKLDASAMQAIFYRYCQTKDWQADSLNS